MTSRRDFLKGVAAAGTLSGLASKSEAQAAQAETQTRAAVSALPPSSYVEAMESDVPGYSEADVAHYFVRHAASDFMTDVIKSLGIDYIASNPHLVGPSGDGRLPGKLALHLSARWNSVHLLLERLGLRLLHGLHSRGCGLLAGPGPFTPKKYRTSHLFTDDANKS